MMSALLGGQLHHRTVLGTQAVLKVREVALKAHHLALPIAR